MKRGFLRGNADCRSTRMITRCRQTEPRTFGRKYDDSDLQMKCPHCEGTASKTKPENNSSVAVRLEIVIQKRNGIHVSSLPESRLSTSAWFRGRSEILRRGAVGAPEPIESGIAVRSVGKFVVSRSWGRVRCTQRRSKMKSPAEGTIQPGRTGSRASCQLARLVAGYREVPNECQR